VGAYVAVDLVRREIVLSIRGSINARNFVTDMDFSWAPCDFVHKCKLHKGFLKAWREMEGLVRPALEAASSRNPGFRVVATGHSLGGAVATIGGAHLRRDGFPVEIYSFGSPRVGNDHWANWMTAQKGGHWRVTHRQDTVPRLPPLLLGYRHVSPEYWLSGSNNGRSDSSIASVRVCPGIANTTCNGRRISFAFNSHMNYLGDVSACLRFRKGQVKGDADPEVEERLRAWGQMDQLVARSLSSGGVEVEDLDAAELRFQNGSEY
jgi:hypothetical protein